MIRIYLDWNVMAQMKGNQHPELSFILSNDTKFFKIYSTSHISDILSSYSEVIDNDHRIKVDLNYISDLTNDYCISNSGKNIHIEQYDPNELFAQQLESRVLLTDFKLDNFLDVLGDDPGMKALIAPYITTLRTTPIDSIFQDLFENPATNKQMRAFFPDLENNMSIEGLLSSFGKMVANLNQTEDYKGLRELLQDGLNINRDKLFNSSEPYKEITKAYEKMGTVIPELSANNSTAPSWFNEISNEYVSLDMHGFQEDKVKVTEKHKSTFKNTTHDAFHAAFASACDFYITNDDRSYRKSIEVFDKLNLNTLIFKPNEFVEYYNQALKDDRFNEFMGILMYVLESDMYLTSKDSGQKTFQVPFFLFNYFNKLYAFNDGVEPYLLLSKDKPTNNKFTYAIELETLVSKLIEGFGPDVTGLGKFAQEEQMCDDWIGREWHHNGILVKLRLLRGRIQLYLYTGQLNRSEDNTIIQP